MGAEMGLTHGFVGGIYSQNRNFGRVKPQTDFRRSEIEKPHFRVVLATQVQSIHYYGLICRHASGLVVCEALAVAASLLFDLSHLTI